MTSQLYDVIHRRRDVRGQFTGEPVAPAVLDRVLGAAHAAPSVGLSQPWDFIVVRDRTLREAFHRHVCHEREVFAASLDAAAAERFARIKIDGVLESTLSIVVTYAADRGAPAVLGRHAIADAGLYSSRTSGWPPRPRGSASAGCRSTVRSSCATCWTSPPVCARSPGCASARSATWKRCRTSNGTAGAHAVRCPPRCTPTGGVAPSVDAPWAGMRPPCQHPRPGSGNVSCSRWSTRSPRTRSSCPPAASWYRT